MTQAMRTFAAWAARYQHRSILLAIVFVQLLPPVAGALLVLDALQRGPRAALLAGLLASAGLITIGIALRLPALEAVSLCLPLVFGAGTGAVVAWSRSLSLAFQIMVIGSVVATLFVFGFAIDPLSLGEWMVGEARQMLELGGLTAAQIEPMLAIPPIDTTRTLPGVLLASSMVEFLLCVLLISALVSLLLGHWWHSLLSTDGQFGADFRHLRLGRVASILLLAFIGLALVWGAPALSAAAPLAAIGFLFQGLAVLHARRHSEGWHRALLVVVYLSLISPLAPLTYLGLSGVGLVDNFFTLRAPV